MNGGLPNATFPVLDGDSVNGQELGKVGLEKMSFEPAAFEVLAQCFCLGIGHLGGFPSVWIFIVFGPNSQVAKRQRMARFP
jgi:hypothetical protein